MVQQPPGARTLVPRTQHSVANMFILSMGYALQGQPTCTSTANKLALINTHPEYCDVSIGRIVGSNLVPVTLGNIIGGAVLVAVALGVPNGRLGRGVDKVVAVHAGVQCCMQCVATAQVYLKCARYDRGAAWRHWPATEKLPV